MLITVECEECRQQYSVDEKFLGRAVSCQVCGRTFVLAVAPRPMLPTSDPFENAVFETPKPPPKPAGRPIHWRNPVETNALDPQDDPRPTAPAVFASSRGPLARVRDRWVDATAIYIIGLCMAITVAYALYITFEIPSGASGRGAAIVEFWETTLVGDILFFVLIAPMVLLAMFATSRIFNFRLGDIAYLRACAVCALPFVFLLVASAFSGPMLMLLALALVPIAFFGLKKFFELDWAEWLAGSVFSIIGFTIGCFLFVSVLGLIPAADSKVSSVKRSGFDSAAYARQFQAASDDNTSASSGNRSQASSGFQSHSARDETLARFKETVLRKINIDLSKATVEERLPDALDLKRQLDTLRPYFRDDPAWPTLTRMVEDFEQKVMTLPSGKLDPSAMTDSSDDDWTTGALSRGKMGAEVSFKQFKFRPPLDMKMDLRCSEDLPTGLVWTGAASNAAAKFSIYSTPRNDSKQRKPVVSDKEGILRAANEAGLLTIEGTNVTSKSGLISGIPFTRVAVNADAPGEHWIKFITPADDRWVIMHLILPSNNPQLAKIMDAAARTIRLAEPGEAKADPFAAKLIAPRLADDYDRAAALLRDQGSAAEDAVAAQLTSPDRLLRQRSLELLQDIATERSLPALRQAALDSDASNAALARMAIRRLGVSTAPQPASAPAPVVTTPTPAPAVPAAPEPPPLVAPTGHVDLTQVIADLDSNDPARKKDAVSKLPFVRLDTTRRPAISPTLAQLFRTRDPAVPLPYLVEAMSVWGDSVLCSDLVPLLQEGSEADQRHAAMKVLGNLKDARAIPAIIRWLGADPVPATDALIAMGPSAEPAVIAVLNDPNATVRIAAARILTRIGTAKCLGELGRAAQDPRDAAARQLAQAALTSIKARLATEAPGAAPVVKP